MSESQQEEQSGDNEIHQERKASPLSGCLIFVILIAVFTSLGGFIIWHYLNTQEAIKQVSDKLQRPVPVAPYVPEELTELKKKLNEFASEVKQGKATSIRITAEELNLGIAKLDKMAEFKGKMFITKIEGADKLASDNPDKFHGSIHAQISFPMKGGLSSENRFLNGTMQMNPVIEQGSLFPIVTEIKPDTGSKMPEKMIRFIPQALFSSYRTDPDLTAVFHKLSTVTLEEGSMVITSDPSYEPPHVPTLSEGSDNLFTALAVCGILFFVLFSTVCLLIWIRNNSKRTKQEKIEQESLSQEQLEAEQAEHREAEERNNS